MKTEELLGRRSFLRKTAALGCGFAGGGIILAAAPAAGSKSKEDGPNILGPREGFSPHIGTLVSMLDWMRAVVLGSVQGLTLEQVDYLHDAKANTIGALVLHLAATERHYQIHTFEEKAWGDWDSQTKSDWGVASGLGEKARQAIKGNKLAYYLDRLKEVRGHTIAELRKRDDTWLMQVDPDWPWGPTNNYCKWFHVCEHESNHNGQIKWIKSRLPDAKEASE